MKQTVIVFLLALSLAGCMPKPEPVSKIYTVEVRFRTDPTLLGTFERNEIEWPDSRGLINQLRIFCDLHNVDMNEMMTHYNLRTVVK